MVEVAADLADLALELFPPPLGRHLPSLRRVDLDAPTATASGKLALDLAPFEIANAPTPYVPAVDFGRYADA